MDEDKKHEHSSHHEKKSKKEHHTKKSSFSLKKLKKMRTWQAATFVLGILLVVSIITQGFTCIGACAADADTVPAEGGELIILSDERCTECGEVTSLLKDRLSQIFANYEIIEMDYSTEEGKSLYDKSGVQFLPAVLFDEGIKSDPNFGEISGYLEAAGDFQSLRIGSSFDPDAEICTNGVDDNGNGLKDCNDPDCASKLVCDPDAISDCMAEKDVAEDTIVFYYSDSCPWCQKMKPGVESLEDDGYKFYWANTADPDAAGFVRSCFGDLVGSGVPQFMCPKNGDVFVGAFTDAERNLDTSAMQKFADDCKNA